VKTSDIPVEHSDVTKKTSDLNSNLQKEQIEGAVGDQEASKNQGEKPLNEQLVGESKESSKEQTENIDG